MYNIESRRYTGSKAKLAPWIMSLIHKECKGKTFADIFAGTGIIAATAAITLAEPNIPSQVIEGTPERRIVDSSAKTVAAQAGNVTQLTITHIMITKRWQGYYGNVTGTITLDDADNNTMYD